MTQNKKMTGNGPAKLRKRRSVAKTELNWIIALVIIIALLIVGYIVADYIVRLIYFEDIDGTQYVIKQKNGIYALYDEDGNEMQLSASADTEKNVYIYFTELGTEVKIDPDNGTHTIYSVVDVEDGEVAGISDRIQMFKQITRDKTEKIEVHNAHGSYTFYIDKNGDFQIKGYEGTPYSPVMFSSLVTSCGYTLSTRKIVDPIKDENGLYTEYGLADEIRVDEEGKEYEYSPYWYRITDIDGNAHTVIIGDPVPSNTGYYVRYTDRDAVYVMDYSVDGSMLGMYDQKTYESLDSILHVPIEQFVSPVVVYPMELNTYFDVQTFTIWNGKDFSDLPDNMTEEEIDAIEIDPIVSFSFWDLEDRTGTFYANTAYVLAHPFGYEANDAAIDTCLQSLYQLATMGVVKLGVTEEDLKAYGLDEPAYIIYYKFQGEYEHTIFVSEETENGTRYMTSAIYDFIVEVDRSEVEFLEYTTNEWVDDLYFSMNLAWATKVEVEYDGVLYTFNLDNSLTDSVTNENCSETAKNKGTISSALMSVIASDTNGNKMEAISEITVTDKSGYKWTIDHETVKAYNPSGDRVNIKGGYYTENARGEEVIALQGYIDCNDGRQIYVSANKIRIMDSNGVLIKEYMRYGMSNFRRFFSAMLYASKEGDVHDGVYGLTDEQIEQILANRDDYDVRIKVETSYKDTSFEFKFYNYSERSAMITVNDGDGEFRVLRSFTKKIAGDALKVILGEPVESTSKY